MREIEYRAWHINSRLYINWDLICNLMEGLSICVPDRLLLPCSYSKVMEDVHTIIYRDINIFKHNDFILEQYVGIKDCKGMKIYEGDVVQVINGDGRYTSNQVNWDEEELQWALGIDCKFELYNYKSSLVVIGNVRDGKDFL